MNAPQVAIAVNSTMLTNPMSNAPPKIVPLDTSSPPLPLALVRRSPTLLLSLLHTPMPPSTRYRNATAIIHTKNSATESTSETLSTLHGSSRRICMLARTGPVDLFVTWFRGVRTGLGPGSGPKGWVAGLRGDRGAGPERSGISDAYTSGRTGSGSRSGWPESRAGASRVGRTASRIGCGGVASRAGTAGLTDPPDMKRLMRASTGDCPVDAPGRPPSVRGGGSVMRFAGRPRDAPRSQGGTSP